MVNSALLEPRSIAVVGASKKIEKPGFRLVKSLADGGYKGEVYPVNPKENEINGLRCYNSLDQLPQIDLGILALHPAACVEAVKYMATEKETRAFIIISAGFAETGEEGKAQEAELKRLAEKYQLAIIGPNCIGVLNTCYKAIFVCTLPEVEEGGIDYVSASGAFAVFMFELAAKQGMRFGSVYSVGNSVTIGVEEILKFWDETYVEGKSGRVKLVYAEQIRKPEMFYTHIRNLRKKGCSVVVLKPGDSDAGARAALSHTGAMAGDKEACDYLIRKAGAIRCYSREELVYIANLLSQKKLKGNNMAIITHAGGPAVMLTDQLQKEGFEVPEIDKTTQDKLKQILHPGSSAINPIDVLATGNKEQLMSCIRLCGELDYIDGVIIIYGKTGMEDLFDTYEGMYLGIEDCPKPVFPVLPSLSSGQEEIDFFVDKGHPAYFDEIMLAHCMGMVSKEPPVYDNIPWFPEISQHDEAAHVLGEEEVLVRLAAGNIPHVKTRLLSREAELTSIGDMKFPLVAKVKGILHKTEHKGVLLNIADQRELQTAFKDLMAIPGASGVVVQEMLKGTELFLGAKRHPGMGWSVHAGPGGILVELMDDRVSSLAPMKAEEAKLLLTELKAGKLFKGFRELPPVDMEVFAALIEKFSMLFGRYPDITEIDLNPLIADGKDIITVDARIITDGSQA